MLSYHSDFIIYFKSIMVLIIKPVNAQLIKDKDTFGKSDPYCVVIIGSEKQRTKTHSGGGKHPQWYDTLQFHNQDAIMRIEVYDDDFGKDDLIGQGTQNINAALSNPGRTQNVYVDLVHHGKSAGRVLVSVEYQGMPVGGNQWGVQQQGYGMQGGWGQQPPMQGGWGQQPPMQGGWGQQPPMQGGWGQQPPQQGGWGQQPPQQGGWGQPPMGGGYGSNNGW